MFYFLSPDCTADIFAETPIQWRSISEYLWFIVDKNGKYRFTNLFVMAYYNLSEFFSSQATVQLKLRTANYSKRR